MTYRYLDRERNEMLKTFSFSINTLQANRKLYSTLQTDERCDVLDVSKLVRK